MWLHITTRRILLSEVLQAKSVNLGTRQHHVHPAHVARIIDKSTSGGPAPAAPPTRCSGRRCRRRSRHAIPTSFSVREYPEAGGLMSYGTNTVDSALRRIRRRGCGRTARIGRLHGLERVDQAGAEIVVTVAGPEPLCARGQNAADVRRGEFRVAFEQQRGSRLVKHHSEEVLCHHCRNEFPDESTNPHTPKLCFPS